jgi:signal transduction histidine kinase
MVAPDGRIMGAVTIERDITGRKRAEDEFKKAQAELLKVSRRVSMADMASSVLHNVGNVLNSVNISATVVSDHLKSSEIVNVARVAAMIREHAADLGAFITRDPRGHRLPDYLSQLAEQLADERATLLKEMGLVLKNVEHIKQILALQQSYARLAGVSEIVKVTDLVEDALLMNAGALARHAVKIIREYQPRVPEITVERHKVLQILVNLISNAKYACDGTGDKERSITLRVSSSDGRVRVDVIDNGVGIPAENLSKIFTRGFTTRKDGHGFGLHNGLQITRELGGSLTTHSDGLGTGATFTLELPLRQPVPPAE